MFFRCIVLFASCTLQIALADEDPIVNEADRSFLDTSEIACYECNSDIDGPMCYDPSMITKEGRLCSQKTGNGGACAVIRLDSSRDLLTNAQPREIQRKCVDDCRSGCVPMGFNGEKLLCTSCCNSTFCNLSNSNPLSASSEPLLIAFMASVLSLYTLLSAWGQ
ncbi:uncharacterized protein LOC100900471 [Galendromus occidentalis]|uniref:Uncharacterized protein LOC100900471 n=1 Tax=Galendromus occidentalis TaxID=34638 RepID=A0AAJ6QYY8_9ACAR|nr:uncharacterized protein LOC100900471 [Galendromus occidentalis]